MTNESLHKTIEEIKGYADLTPRILSAESTRGIARLFLGDGRVTLGELVMIPSTGEALRVRELCGQREAIASTLNGRLKATASTPIELTGMPARLPIPKEHIWRLEQAQYVSPEDHDRTLPALPKTPRFEQLDGQREHLPTAIAALDLLSPLSRGGINLVLDASPGRKGFEALRERVERALGPDVTRMTARQEPLEEPEVRQVIASDANHETFYTALRVATSCVQVHNGLGEEVFFFVNLPALSSAQAWQRYAEGGHTREGAEMGYGEVVSWLGDQLASTRSARVTTLITLMMEGLEGSLEAIADTMALGDVDALIVIDEQGRYAPQRSRSRVPQSAEATRARGILHRASKAQSKLTVFGEDELTLEELSALEESVQWRPVVYERL